MSATLYTQAFLAEARIDFEESRQLSEIIRDAPKCLESLDHGVAGKFLTTKRRLPGEQSTSDPVKAPIESLFLAARAIIEIYYPSDPVQEGGTDQQRTISRPGGISRCDELIQVRKGWRGVADC